MASIEADDALILPHRANPCGWNFRERQAAFFVGGDRGNAAELGRLKGEMDALEQASIKKNCGIQFRQG